MNLVVCGSAGTHPGPGRACSSYLVEHDGQRVLLDLGNGAMANLQQVVDVGDLDALVLTHQHPDHFADVYGLYYALRFHPDPPREVDVYAPKGTREFVCRLLPADSHDSFDRFCPVDEVAAGDVVAMGGVSLRFFAAAHPVETLAVRVEAGGRVLAYSSDSAPSDQVVACARDADLFVADASWLESGRPHPPGVHSTGLEAGHTAAAAGARRLLVTHVYPRLDPEQVAEEARTVFDGEVLVAEDLTEVQL